MRKEEQMHLTYWQKRSQQLQCACGWTGRAYELTQRKKVKCCPDCLQVVREKGKELF